MAAIATYLWINPGSPDNQDKPVMVCMFVKDNLYYKDQTGLK